MAGERSVEDASTEDLRASLRRLEALVSHASDPILVIDDQRRVCYVSPAAAAFLGAEVASVGRLLTRLPREDAQRARAAFRELLEGPEHSLQLLARVERSDGRSRQLLITFTDLRADEAVGAIVVSGRDLSDELTARARLEHHATHDALTGLANRELLLDELRLATDPRSDQLIGLVLLDLLGMSGVNDRVGLRTGDLLLRSVAQRLREAAGPATTVARTSGDEFAVLVREVADEGDALLLGERFARLFDQPYLTPGGGTVLLRVQVGVATARARSTTPATLLRDATLALGAARSSPGSAVRVCGPELRAAEERRLAMEYELATPGVVDGLNLVFQPVVDLRADRTCGFEALVRWQHPRFGVVEPEEFVPVAERNGAIIPIGNWVLHAATDQLAIWDAAGVTTDECLAVNVSARQLLDIDLAASFERALRRTGLDPHRLILEITETALADESHVTTQTVAALAELGAAIHIDDFGMGYSSFAQLGRFPFQGLKIDRSFVAPLGVSDDAVPVLTALLNLARAQGLEVTAEGIEHDQQASQLRALGCRRGQGYHWARPLPAEDVPAWLALHRTRLPAAR
ncbi:MAG: putative bifunctional diguanylate cyclase/phosphodiesterase [Nitriliruptoraceae bacterium]